MVTHVDKIKKADDAGCDVFNAIRTSSYWGFNEPEMSKKLLFEKLEDAVKDIDPTRRYIDMDSFMSLIQRERTSAPSDPNEGKIQRQVARVNLFVFAVAIWTGEKLDEAVHEFFRNVIPKDSLVYSDQLFDLYVAVLSWAANIQVDALYVDVQAGATGRNVMGLLEDYFPETLGDLGLSDTDRNLHGLLEKIRNKFQWINELTELELWDEDVQLSKAAIRRNWINIIYEILGEFGTLYPVPDTQRTAVDEVDEQMKNTQDVARGNRVDGNPVLEEDNDDEFTTVPTDIDTNNESVDMDEEEHEENNNGDQEVVTNSFKRSIPVDNDGAEEEEQELENLPVKRPRVIPANSQDNQSVLDRDSDDLDSTDNSTERNPNDISSPQLTNLASNHVASTPASAVNEQHSNEHIPTEQSVNENQPSEQPANQDNSDENVSSENLPHGLPRTINEGPAEGFSEESDSDDDYADALQTTEAERSQSVASVPTRTRRDLPSSRTARQAGAAITTTTTETTRTTTTNAEITNDDNDNTDATNTTTTPSNTIPTTVASTVAMATTATEGPSALKPRKPYTPWTAEEIDALEAGLNAHGGQWALIKKLYKDALCNRTNVQLKDKARNELNYRKKAGEPLGVYARLDTEATSFPGQASARRAIRRAVIKRRREMTE